MQRTIRLRECLDMWRRDTAARSGRRLQAGSLRTNVLESSNSIILPAASFGCSFLQVRDVSEKVTAVERPTGRGIHYHTSWSVLTTKSYIHYSCADAYGMTSTRTYRHAVRCCHRLCHDHHERSFDECMEFPTLTGISLFSFRALDCGVRALSG